MSHNTFGHLFRVTTFGESHGPALGCVVDGCPPGIPLTEADIQAYLDKRRPGPVALHHPAPGARRRCRSSPACSTTSDRRAGHDRHADRAADRECRPALQGLCRDQDKYRPGHADFTYDVKYGIRDYRGGGRSSARETAARVAAGAIARKVVPGVHVRGALVQMGPHKIDRATLGLGRGRPQSVLLPRRRRRRRLRRAISTASARRARRSAR